MNKVGIYYAYWTRDWDTDFHPFIDRVAKLGFDVLEVNAGTIADLSTRARLNLIDHAAERNVTLSFCVGLSPQYDVASEDETVRRSGVAFLQRIAQAIGEMGGGNLGGIIYGSWPATLPAGQMDKRPFVERSIASM